jgi:hypothetical protein
MVTDELPLEIIPRLTRRRQVDVLPGQLSQARIPRAAV